MMSVPVQAIMPEVDKEGNPIHKDPNDRPEWLGGPKEKEDGIKEDDGDGKGKKKSGKKGKKDDKKSTSLEDPAPPGGRFPGVGPSQQQGQMMTMPMFPQQQGMMVPYGGGGPMMMPYGGGGPMMMPPPAMMQQQPGFNPMMMMMQQRPPMMGLSPMGAGGYPMPNQQQAGWQPMAAK